MLRKMNTSQLAQRILGPIYAVTCFGCEQDFEAVFAWERTCADCNYLQEEDNRRVIAAACGLPADVDATDWYTG